MSFGIDFGTTNSVLAHWNGEDAEVLALDATNLDDWNYPGFASLFPSMVGVSSVRDRVLFGWEAKLRSEQAVPAAKRLLAGDSDIMVGTRSWPASTVSAGIFRTIRDRANSEQLLDVDTAVVTVPANSAGAARFRTRAAAREAGIRADSLINEPTAAALYYKQQIGSDALENVVTFDWGGGTIDVTILEAEEGLFEERAARGVAQLGGLEIDQALRNLVLAKAKHGPQGFAEEAAFVRDVELAKIRLSTESVVAVPSPGGRSSVEITREEFEDAIRPIVTKAIGPLQHCLADLDRVPEDIDSVLMIGGSSQIPLVRQMVGEVMGDRLVSADVCDPMTAVAQGAAVAAAINSGDLEIDLAVGTTHALGTASTRTDGDTEIRSFSQIIPRNATLPRSQERTYRPNRPGQKRLGVEIWEGDPADPVNKKTGADNGSNICLTELKIDLPAFRDPNEASFTLTYTYDVNGLLEVRAVLDRTQEVLVDREINAFGLSTTGVGVSAASLREFLETQPGLPSRGSRSVAQTTSSAREEQEPKLRPSLPGVSQVLEGSASEPRPLVIDGSNLAWGSQNRSMGGQPTLARLHSALEELRTQHPGTELIVFVDANFRHVVPDEEKAQVDREVAGGKLHRVPAGTVGGADVYLLDIARKKNGVVVSNDSFSQYTEYHSWLAGKGRLFGGTEVSGIWAFKERRPIR
ncbi:Hsp70 family protein [Nocardiopsis ganjiahuensis]|uniref:Hsp70 family protein n=1 Tax=Nocardiopsis ganjiahuensis TaxID=239984 RepID=UPI00034C7540|nr:Hsp70 family protein [Nocardiopsis ganjiahuensis]